MKYSNLFLVRLFFYKRSLFIIVLVFIILNLSANFIFKAEVTPFFKWDLYASPIPAQKEYSFLEIKYNGDSLLTFPHTWSEPEKLFFTNTLDYFIAIRRNNNADPFKNYFINDWSQRHFFIKRFLQNVKIYNDSDGIEHFPEWYKNYLEQYLHKPVWAINIYETKISYKIDGSVNQDSSTLIYKLL